MHAQCGADGCVRQRHVWDVSVTDPPPPFGLCCHRLQTAGPAAAAGLASAPDARSDGSLGTAPPTTPRGASSPGTGGGGGGRGGRKGTYVHSQCNCQTGAAEFLNSEIRRLQVGPPSQEA